MNWLKKIIARLRRRPAPQAPRRRPTREEILALPVFDALDMDAIVEVNTPARAAQAWAELSGEAVVGFDTESKPTFAKGEVSSSREQRQLVASSRGTGVSTGYEDVEAGVVAVKHSGRGTHVRERAEHHRRIVRAHGKAQLHRTLTIELAMHAAAQMPAAIHATRHQIVFRTTQSAVGVEAKKGGDRQRRRVTFDGAKVQSQHVAGIYLQRRL